MYNGYDISPRNLQTRVVTLSVVFPEAPRQTNKGNATAKHIVSYKPFIHRCSLPPILGIADKRANTASPHPADNTNTERTFVESLCRKNAYRILPIYSKNRDQLGPFRGYISPTPRISIPGVAGIRKVFISVASINAIADTCETSQTEQP